MHPISRPKRRQSIPKVFSLDVVIGNSTDVTVKKIDAAYLTRGALDSHNRDTSAHSNITDQIKAILGSANWNDSRPVHLLQLKLIGTKALSWHLSSTLMRGL